MFKILSILLVVFKAVFIFACFRSLVIAFTFPYEYINKAQFALGLAVLFMSPLFFPWFVFYCLSVVGYDSQCLVKYSLLFPFLVFGLLLIVNMSLTCG
jgi:hypothetical protein